MITVTDCKSLGMSQCPRCWKWHYADLNYDKLCNRCVHVMITEYPTDERTIKILENLNARGLSPEDNPYLCE